MNPYPFWPLNHLTLPCATELLLPSVAVEPRRVREGKTHGAFSSTDQRTRRSIAQQIQRRQTRSCRSPRTAHATCARLQRGRAFLKTAAMPGVAGEASTAPTARPRVKRARKPRRVRDASRLYLRAEYLTLRAAFGLLGALPLDLALRVGEAVAWLAYLLAAPLRRVGMTNLAIAFPDRSVSEHRRILRESMLNHGRMAAELAHLPRLDDARLRDMVRFEDETWWREAIGWERPTGVLILSGHFGNWELLVFAHGRRGYPVTMVHRPMHNPLIDRWLNRVRGRAGTRLVRKHHAATAVLRALREKQLLVLPFDQNSTRGLGVFVDFFGVPASTNAGIARIGLRADAPVVPAFIVRQGRQARHLVHVLPIMELENTGDARADVVRNTARLSAVFEDMVRRFPEQWLWVHRRWKTRPEGEPSVY